MRKQQANLQDTGATAQRVLHVQNLSVTLAHQTILAEISFDLHAGEMIILLGPNGAGKSVLLRTLSGFHDHTGQVEWSQGIHISFLPCDFTPPQELPLTVSDFFSFRHIDKKSIEQAFSSISMRVSQTFLSKKMSELSSGQLRRVLIAWILTDNPDVILLDEPFSHIDSVGRDRIFDAFLNLCRTNNIAMLFVSHDLSKQFQKADRMIALNKKILMNDKPSAVMTPHNLIRIYESDSV